MVTNCNHVFGRDSITEWLSTEPFPGYCPLCKAQVTIEELRPHNPTRSKLGLPSVMNERYNIPPRNNSPSSGGGSNRTDDNERNGVGNQNIPYSLYGNQRSGTNASPSGNQSAQIRVNDKVEFELEYTCCCVDHKNRSTHSICDSAFSLEKKWRKEDFLMGICYGGVFSAFTFGSHSTLFSRSVCGILYPIWLLLFLLILILEVVVRIILGLIVFVLLFIGFVVIVVLGIILLIIAFPFLLIKELVDFLAQDN